MELGEEYGITVKKVSERDTSRTCCLCGKRHVSKVKRGLWVCREMNMSLDADAKGAVNMLKVAVNRFLSNLTPSAGGGRPAVAGSWQSPCS